MSSALKINFDSPLARHRQLAPSASVRVSPLCLGAMIFGEKQTHRYGEITKSESFAILDHFYSQGGNFIDTSNNYQLGQSEEWLGEWIELRGTREDIVLATKYSSDSRSGDHNIIRSNCGGNGTKSMKLSLELSLKRLKTSYVDILYVHYWDYATPVEEVMQSLNDLIRAGKVHYLGISDAPAWIVTKANQYARMSGLRPFVIYQGMWSAALRDFERDIIPMCEDEGMGLIPYGVLNQGRFQTEKGFKERETHNPGRNFIPLSDHDKKISKALEDLANRKGSNIFAVAVAYVRAKAPFVFPLVGARKVGHIKGNIEALDVSLTDKEVHQIDTAYPFDHGFPHTFLSGTLISGEVPHRGAAAPQDVSPTKILGNFDWVQKPRSLDKQ
ncbi:probable voltage-gated shaker-like K+ channel, subunit beta/KCNAB [Fusarium oxysporum]|uniref:Probable voltage-gated shaker-like K+ channel, subunit beta/KCNAB n=1 Tax=Fusarium oxysporum TaxID=5507 RepID=A0A2H3TVL6_FUSOX|nr:probable voltage-gated shaker-like K+ channel, subunit beta/KCNAB [Fusarium oxysporum]